MAPLTAPTQAANDVAGRGAGVKSKQALTLARDLLDAPPTVRLGAIRDVADREWLVLLLEVQRISRAEKLAAALGSKAAVRVKVDTIGVGWGVVGMLERWAGKRHRAQIMPVNVAEKPERDDEGAVLRPYRKRDEMWLAMRALLQPDPATGEGRLRLRLDHQALVQLSLPKLGTHPSSYALVESKKSLRARGLSSPDRAEAALLAVYEPEPIAQRKRRGLLN